MIDPLESRRLFVSFAPTLTFGDRGAIVTGHAIGMLLRLTDGGLITLHRGGDKTNPYELHRYTETGVDTAFGDQGQLFLPGSNENEPQLAPAAKARLIVAHETSNNLITVRRLKVGGGNDANFSARPLAFNGVQADALGVTVDAEQRVYVGVRIASATGGKAVDFRIYRFHADGTLDRDYGRGKGYALVYSSADGSQVPVDLQPDAGRGGSIFVLVGHDRNAIVRKLTPAGRPDGTFGTRGTSEFLAAPDPGFGAFASVTGLRIDAQNRPFVAGVDRDDYPTMYLTRLTAAGAVDPAFATAGRLTLRTTKFASMEERLFDEIIDFEVSRADGKIIVVTDASIYRFTKDGVGDESAGKGGLIDTGRADTYPAFGQASAAAAVGVTPAIKHIELGDDGRLFASGNVYIRTKNDGNVGDLQPRLVELAPRADALVVRKVLYVNGTEGGDRIRISTDDARVTLLRNGVTTHFAAGKINRVQVDLREGNYNEQTRYDDVRVTAGLPATIFGGPRVDRIATVAPSVIVAGNEDLIRTGDGDDALFLSDGGGGQAATGEGDDTVFSISSFDSLLKLDLGGGDDRLDLYGNDYNDKYAATYLLGRGDDVVNMNAFHIYIDAGRGADRFIAGGYRNTLLGGAGDDLFEIADQSNLVDGGEGNDQFAIGINGLRNTIAGGAGNDFLTLIQDATVSDC